ARMTARRMMTDRVRRGRGLSSFMRALRECNSHAHHVDLSIVDLAVARRLLDLRHQPLSSMLSTSERPARVLPDLGLTAPPIIPPVQTRASSRPAPGILFVIAGFALLGIGFALWLRTVPAGHPDPRLWFNVFYCLFARHEPLGLALVATFSVGSALFFFRGGSIANEHVDLSRWFCPLAALFAFAVTALGTDFVFHNYPLTADEHLADFQARIFLHGKIQGHVPDQWVPALHVIKPTFVDYFPATQSWNQTYLPVYAAMRAAFQAADLQSLLNPFLAAVTVLAVYGTARNIWPQSKANAAVAVALLVSCSQFLLMSMTSYAMPAHLALNAVWLWLY